MEDEKRKGSKLFGCLRVALALLIIGVGIWGYTHPQDEERVRKALPKIPDIDKITKKDKDQGRKRRSNGKQIRNIIRRPVVSMIMRNHRI